LVLNFWYPGVRPTVSIAVTLSPQYLPDHDVKRSREEMEANLRENIQDEENTPPIKGKSLIRRRKELEH